jgi:hypothetical protein
MMNVRWRMFKIQITSPNTEKWSSFTEYLVLANNNT